MKKIFFIISYLFLNSTFASEAIGFTPSIANACMEFMISGRSLDSLTVREKSTVLNSYLSSIETIGEKTKLNLSQDLKIEDIIKFEISSSQWNAVTITISHMAEEIVPEFSKEVLERKVKKIIRNFKSRSNENIQFEINVSLGGSKIDLFLTGNDYKLSALIIKELGEDLEEYTASIR
ncbi:MAG: hypothetical protein H6622_07210 [Halobacteriovoraceae bacterium]|nr:hypothetical protein [Halobacteriovoraceae bacterium]